MDTLHPCKQLWVRIKRTWLNNKSYVTNMKETEISIVRRFPPEEIFITKNFLCCVHSAREPAASIIFDEGPHKRRKYKTICRRYENKKRKAITWQSNRHVLSSTLHCPVDSSLQLD